MQGKLSSMTSNWIVISPTRTREDRKLCRQRCCLHFSSHPRCEQRRGLLAWHSTNWRASPLLHEMKSKPRSAAEISEYIKNPKHLVPRPPPTLHVPSAGEPTVLSSSVMYLLTALREIHSLGTRPFSGGGIRIIGFIEMVFLQAFSVANN